MTKKARYLVGKILRLFHAKRETSITQDLGETSNV